MKKEGEHSFVCKTESILPFASANEIIDLGRDHRRLLNVTKPIFAVTDLHEVRGRENVFNVLKGTQSTKSRL